MIMSPATRNTVFRNPTTKKTHHLNLFNNNLVRNLSTFVAPSNCQINQVDTVSENTSNQDKKLTLNLKLSNLVQLNLTQKSTLKSIHDAVLQSEKTAKNVKFFTIYGS